MIRKALVCAAMLGLAACSGTVQTDQVEADIALACGEAVVKAKLPQVCADPARYARDASTAEWVAKNLADILKARAAQR